MAILLLLGAIVVSKKLSDYVEEVSGEKVNAEDVIVVIDPGHGGEDPGKVGVNDVLEKDINLQIGMKVKTLLEGEGVQVIMTREDDNVPKIKREDLEERIALINEVNPDMVICIHQNSFTDPTVAGAQVFYHGSSEISREIAQILQEELWAMDGEHKREIKGNENYYMLSETKVPTVIVECGFLSNQDDAEKLKTDEYQNEIANAINMGIIKWLDK